ncbi:MAG: hypothetical protein ABI832_15030 [bacterium]
MRYSAGTPVLRHHNARPVTVLGDELDAGGFRAARLVAQGIVSPLEALRDVVRSE